jgi:hypothetical protein
LKHCHPKYWNITINESAECRKILNTITNTLMENIEIMDTEFSVNIEKIITSDTANVRQINYENTNGENSYTLPMSSILLYDENNGRDAVQLKSKALNSLGKTMLPNVVQVARSEKPINEFENNSELFLGSFPNLFIFGSFGNCVKIIGTLPNKYIRHLLKQR